MFEKVETLEEWALKNQHTVFRFWDKGCDKEECDYIFIEELIVAPNNKIIMGNVGYDSSKPNQRFDYKGYCFLDDVMIAISPEDQDEIKN